MLIDAVFIILMLLACFKGLRKGLIVAVFSILGFIVGIAAALKLSTVVAGRLSDHVTNGEKWLPVVSFLLVFIAVAFLVNFCGRLIQKSFEVAMLGWANRLAGALLYAILYSIIMSVFLFYAVQLRFVQLETTQQSIVYPFLQPIGPKVIDGFGTVIPWFKDMFEQLQQFFRSVGTKTQQI